MSTKNLLDPYCGRLTLSEVARGMNAARTNARRLLADAKLLADQNRLPSAMTLAILAIEEAGKLPILRHIAIAETDEEVRRVWKNYRSHTKKNAFWILPDLVGLGLQSMDEFMSAVFDGNSDHCRLLDALKQVGFYTDCLAKAHWSVPEDVIDAGIARGMIHVAEVLVGTREITAEEIELYVKFVKPAKFSAHAMREATVQWEKAMEARGLIQESKMEQLVRSGLAALKRHRKPN